MRASVVYVPTCPRANVIKACQILIFTCQRVSVSKVCQRRSNFSTWRVNVPKVCQVFNLACQRAKRCANFSSFSAKRRANCFNYISKENLFQFLNFPIMVNICESQEYLSKSRKFISQTKGFKF